MTISGLQSAYSVKPLNYSINSEASFSDSFVGSVKKNNGVAVLAASPVNYPNASLVKQEGIDDVKSTSSNAVYEKIANNFQGSYTGYGQSGLGSTYEIVGSNIDYRV